MGPRSVFSSTLGSSTPFTLISTRNGAVPHLTHDTLEALGLSASTAFLVPMNWIVKNHKIVSSSGKGLSHFMGLPTGSKIILTHTDPSEPLKSGYNKNNSISIWHMNNRMDLTSQSYMDVVKVSKAQAFVGLCDSDTPKDATNKRLSKSVTNSLRFLDQCNDTKSEDQEMIKTALIGAIQGGQDPKARKASAEQTAKRPVDMFLLDGFHLNGAQSMTMDISEVTPILKDIINVLPQEKVRCFFGGCDPKMILELVSIGVDVFESSYAYFMAEEGRALTVPTHLSSASDTLTVNLRDDTFKEDFSPISDACTCYTCKKHTRAYINHLLLTKEMLSLVLLMIHNLHHYLVFFESIRSSIDSGKFELFKQKIDQCQ